MDATAPPPFSDAPERIAQVIWVLCQTVTERCSLRVRTLTVAQVEYIVARLLAARTRFRRVVALIRAGKPPQWRARKPRARRVTPKPALKPMSDAELKQGFPPPPGWKRWAREDRARERAARQAALAAAPKKPVPVWRTLRQHLPGWLCGCAPAIWEFPRSGASCANELRMLLAEPEMRALLARHRCVGDSLRTVCWGLGVERSLLYPAPTMPLAPAEDAPAFADPTPPAAESATPPIVGPPCAAIVAPPPAETGGARASQTSPSLPAREDDFFKRG